MSTLTLTKIENGFTIQEKSETYTFESYVIDDKGTTIQNEVLDDTIALIGTNKGTILLTTDCTINEQTYFSITEFITTLYA